MLHRLMVPQILGLVLVLSSATVLQAQINRGVIEGSATDPQGAFAPGVEVVITSLDTNVTSPTKTNNVGYYRVVDLVPGKYRARFQAAGFTALEIKDIEVPAGKVTRVDAQLRINPLRQSVEVLAEVPLIETGASNSSITLETRTIEEVPVGGRDLMQLVFLMPGVNSVAGPPGSNFGFNSQFGSIPDPTSVLGSNLSVNGGQAGTNAWYLDGNLNISSYAQNVVVNPSPDAVQEFQAITNAFAPEYGRTGGAVFSVVLKSGTNSPHGNLYEFVRTDATNARNPFTSIDSNGNLIKDRQLRYNNFGGTFGGPLFLPKLYNGKDKTFFFFSWEARILHLQGQQTFTVPTARMRHGDFSEDPNAAQKGIWDPFSTVGPDQNGVFTRTAFGTPVPGNPFGNNGCTNAAVEQGASSGKPTCNFATQIPASRLDPIAMFFMNSFPMPNYNDPRSSCPMGKDGFKVCSNFLGAVGTAQDQNNISLKVDHQWGPKTRWFVEWLYNPGSYRNFRVPWTGPTYPTSQVGYGTHQPVNFRNQIYGLGNTYTPTPTTVSEFRYSFSRQFLTATGGAVDYLNKTAAQADVVQTLAPVRLPTSQYYASPSFSISMPVGGSLPFGPEAWNNAAVMSEAHTFMENLTKIVGKHTMKIGVTYRLEHATWDGTAPTSLGFPGTLTADPTTGQGGGGGLAQFMLGAVGSGDGNNAGLWLGPYERWRSWGVYWQDDFHVTSRFTLNFGLRWDLYGSLKTRSWRPNSKLCLQCINPLTGLKGQIIYEGDPEYPTGSDLYPANKTDFGPRFNFSWAPFTDRKTIIRGGYNIFTSNAADAINMPGAFASPGWGLTVDWNKSFYPDQCANFTGQCVAFPLSDTTMDKSQLTFPVLTGKFPAQMHDPLLGQGQGVAPKPSRDPMVQMWTLQVQRELPGNMMIDVGYVGNHGTHLFSDPNAQLSYVHTADKLKYKNGINASVPITDYYSGVTAAKLAEVYGGPEQPRSLLLQDYPFFPGTQMKAFDGTSLYHGLNVRVQKKYSHGFSFIAAYTYSKKITNLTSAAMTRLVEDPIHGSGGANNGRYVYARSNKFYQDPDNRNDRVIAVDDVPQMFNYAASYELPVGSGKPLLNGKGIANGVLGGWKLTGTFNAQAGLPISVSCPADQLTSRCNLVGDPNFPGGRSKAEQIAQWINPAAFEPAFGSDQKFWANYNSNDPRAWVFGNAGALLPFLRTPGFWNVDASLTKEFHITESKYFQFRWEAFNALNHQNLGLPNTSFCLPPLPDGSVDRVHRAGCSFGRITNIQTDPRAMEFALKFFF